MTNEIWKIVEDFKGYEVSNMGNLRIIHNKKKTIQLNKNNYGYIRKTMYNHITKKCKRVSVHRIVAKAFISNNDSSKNFINHKDGNRSNNKVDNLEWLSHSQNIKHAYDTGLCVSIGCPIKLDKIDPNTKKIIKTYNSYKDAIKDIDTNGHKMAKSIKNNILLKGYFWKQHEKFRSLKNEKWKSINEHNKYQISNMGRVKNNKGKILKLKKNNRPYSIVGLRTNNKTYTPYIHRLVASHFILNTNNYKFVNHINGIKQDNKFFNLEWCSQSQNIKHAVMIGLAFSKKITQYTISNRPIQNWPSIQQAAVHCGISNSNIWNVLNGKKKMAGGYKWKYNP